MVRDLEPVNPRQGQADAWSEIRSLVQSAPTDITREEDFLPIQYRELDHAHFVFGTCFV
jgi:hypothetical protein